MNPVVLKDPTCSKQQPTGPEPRRGQVRPLLNQMNQTASELVASPRQLRWLRAHKAKRYAQGVSGGFTNQLGCLFKRQKFVPSGVKNWICYGKRNGPNSKDKGGTETFLVSSEIEVTKMIYDQQNMIKCFDDRNF